MKTLEDWKDAYYEQQALHTEATGILSAQVRDRDAKIAELSSLLSETSRWIPVSERMPTDKGMEIVFYGGDRKATYHGCYDGQFWAYDKGWVANVTHWMPLPGAPK